MLQINSGKLFKEDAGRQNELRGVLYTNLKLGRGKIIETVAGNLLSTSTVRGSLALVYEVTEKIESRDKKPGIVVSHGVEPYISDFGAVVSFALNCICTPDYELSARLTNGQRGLSTFSPPNKILNRTFDVEIWCKDDDEKQLIEFVEKLIGLRRKHYLGVMRAIRTYVTGIHRIADDFELAYTLLVASVESLAQKFDGHKGEWSDVEESKREVVDKALSDADEAVSERVRSAILEIEHTAISRRFRNFAIEHIRPPFFREEAIGVERPMARSDLIPALNNAYRARSGYIHSLKELPRSLKLGHSFAETMQADGEVLLTLQGLARLTRQVIFEFVKELPAVEKESYDYSHELAGIAHLPLDPKYWIGNTKGFNERSGSARLKGFLEQLSQCVDGTSEASITDMRPVLEKAEGLFPTMKKDFRRPFIVQPGSEGDRAILYGF